MTRRLKDARTTGRAAQTQAAAGKASKATAVEKTDPPAPDSTLTPIQQGLVNEYRASILRLAPELERGGFGLTTTAYDLRNRGRGETTEDLEIALNSLVGELREQSMGLRVTRTSSHEVSAFIPHSAQGATPLARYNETVVASVWKLPTAG